MILNEKLFGTICKEIVRTLLELSALIQDINQCWILEYLNELNSNGRKKISVLRCKIEQLTALTDIEEDAKKKIEMLSIINNYKSQLSASIEIFCQTNLAKESAINKKSRIDLLSNQWEEKKIRYKKDKYNAVNNSNKITTRLLDISKYLADTAQLSENVLESLVISSDKVLSTKKELEHQQQVIVQSGKLLGKYGRRELTDKVLLILVFTFFLACCFYIIQGRTF